MQQVGAALWALSTTGDRPQETSALMKLAVLPDEAVKRNPAWVAPHPEVSARSAAALRTSAAFPASGTVAAAKVSDGTAETAGANAMRWRYVWCPGLR